MANVLKNLHKKDSTQALLEAFEDSLHRADHIKDNPAANNLGDMLTKDETADDDYSKLLDR